MVNLEEVEFAEAVIHDVITVKEAERRGRVGDYLLFFPMMLSGFADSEKDRVINININTGIPSIAVEGVSTLDELKELLKTVSKYHNMIVGALTLDTMSVEGLTENMVKQKRSFIYAKEDKEKDTSLLCNLIEDFGVMFYYYRNEKKTIRVTGDALILYRVLEFIQEKEEALENMLEFFTTIGSNKQPIQLSLDESSLLRKLDILKDKCREQEKEREETDDEEHQVNVIRFPIERIKGYKK